MVVTPPQAAAIVPDSKSSTLRTPPTSASRWVCTSTPPGRTSSPVASISRRPGARDGSIAAMRPPSTPTSARTESAAVTTVPPRTTSSWLTMDPSPEPRLRGAAPPAPPSPGAHTCRSCSQGKPVEVRHVRSGDLPPLLGRHAVQDALQDDPRAWEGRFGMRIVRPPEEQVDADERAVADTNGIFLEAEEHVAVEEVTRSRVPSVAMPVGAPSPLRVGVVEPIEEVGHPGDLVLGRTHAQARVALEHPFQDEVAQGHAHPVVRVGEERRP